MICKSFELNVVAILFLFLLRLLIFNNFYRKLVKVYNIVLDCVEFYNHNCDCYDIGYLSQIMLKAFCLVYFMDFIATACINCEHIEF